MLQWKAENAVPDKVFEKVLKILKKKLPKDNELPDNTYVAKKVVCPLVFIVLLRRLRVYGGRSTSSF